MVHNGPNEGYGDGQPTGKEMHKMKKVLVVLLVALMVAPAIGMAQGKKAKGEDSKAQVSKPVTHPQLAELLVKALGLVRFLPASPSAQQMFTVLMQNGIVPQDGWKLDAVVTKADLARVIVQALGMEDRVENPNDPQSWINLLKQAGISLERLSQTIQSVEALPEGMAQDVTLSSTDPLIYGENLAPGSSIQYTVDLNLVTRVLSEMEMISGEFRPISPTPH